MRWQSVYNRNRENEILVFILLLSILRIPRFMDVWKITFIYYDFIIIIIIIIIIIKYAAY